jgi:drug/metabolite transporter (DMT)-like permease
VLGSAIFCIDFILIPMPSDSTKQIATGSPAYALAPMFALLIGASFWGVVWYPFRLLKDAGVSGASASALTYLVALIVGSVLFARHWRDLFRSPSASFFLALSAGICNVSYVIGVTEGEVMRVTLLFYLAPLWTVPLAYWLLGEKLDLRGVFVTVVAMIGALTMLWRAELGMPMPQNYAEWLGLLAGITFAANNVMVRKMDHASPAAKSIAIWVGVTIVGFVTALLLSPNKPLLPDFNSTSLILVFGIAIALMVMSVAIQYGLTHLAANTAAVILLFELIVACIATYMLTNEQMRPQDWVGGSLIAVAGFIASVQMPRRKQPN